MLTLNKTPKTISEQEKDAELAEGRKNSLEVEIVSLGENKKNLEINISKIKEEIKIDNVKLQEGRDKIFKLNEDILEVQNTLREETQKLEDLKIKNSSKIKELEDYLKDKEKYKETLNVDIFDLSKKFELDKFNISQKIKDLENSKKTIIIDIKKLKLDKEQNIQETNLFLEKKEEINKEIKKLNEYKTSLESSNISLGNIIEDKKGVIENNKLIIKNQETVIQNKELEIVELNKSIEVKKIELDGLTKQAFSILNKQQLLDQKTAFIKGQYERAGIKWEE